ncbi:MAG: hypothetical protein IPL43_00185 [Micropruina sp.]|nr:hypothetical protein [Micropruina sp.]
MATVGQLLTVLHRRVWELGTPQEHPPAQRQPTWPPGSGSPRQRSVPCTTCPSPGSDVAARTVAVRAVLEPLANGSLIHEPLTGPIAR